MPRGQVQTANRQASCGAGLPLYCHCRTRAHAPCAHLERRQSADRRSADPRRAGDCQVHRRPGTCRFAPRSKGCGGLPLQMRPRPADDLVHGVPGTGRGGRTASDGRLPHPVCRPASLRHRGPGGGHSGYRTSHQGRGAALRAGRAGLGQPGIALYRRGQSVGRPRGGPAAGLGRPGNEHR